MSRKDFTNKYKKSITAQRDKGLRKQEVINENRSHLKVSVQGQNFFAKKFVKSPVATDMLNSVSPMTKFAMEEALPLINKQVSKWNLP